MDFGKPHTAIENSISKSKIRLLDPLLLVDTGKETAQDNKNLELDNHAIAAANRVATETLLLPGTAIPAKDHAWLLDTSLMKTRLTEMRDIIQEGDLVVIQESFNSLDFVYCTAGEIYHNRNGSFAHNDIIGKPYGTKLRSQDFQGFAFCFLLKPTPELWTQSLNHRTQVIHELDQSQIIWQLQLRPNCIVVESGTGSGALSHSILRAIAPAGHLHTYEFNEHRSLEAKKDFQLHGLSHLVSVYHKDVCRAKTTTDPPNNVNGRLSCEPGFYQDAASVDAVVLDLPEPWWAVPHAAFICRPDGRIASYSPCVEQTQRTIVALEKAGFHSIQTMEYRLREHYVDEFVRTSPPSRPRETKPAHDPSVYKDNLVIQRDIDKETKTGSKRQSSDDTIRPDEVDPKMLVARPFVTIKGHTAFLTFATAGLLPQPNPNAKMVGT